MKAKHHLTAKHYHIILVALAPERRHAMRQWLDAVIAKDRVHTTLWAERIEWINDTAEAVLEAAVDYGTRASQIGGF